MAEVKTATVQTNGRDYLQERQELYAKTWKGLQNSIQQKKIKIQEWQDSYESTEDSITTGSYITNLARKMIGKPLDASFSQKSSELADLSYRISSTRAYIKRAITRSSYFNNVERCVYFALQNPHITSATSLAEAKQIEVECLTGSEETVFSTY